MNEQRVNSSSAVQHAWRIKQKYNILKLANTHYLKMLTRKLTTNTFLDTCCCTHHFTRM